MPTESDGIKELDMLLESAIADAEQAARELMEERRVTANLRHQITHLQAELGKVMFENRTLIEQQTYCDEHP